MKRRPNRRINADLRQRRFAPLSQSGYAERWAAIQSAPRSERLDVVRVPRHRDYRVDFEFSPQSVMFDTDTLTNKVGASVKAARFVGRRG